MMTDQVKGENDDRVKLRHAAYPRRRAIAYSLVIVISHWFIVKVEKGEDNDPP